MQKGGKLKAICLFWVISLLSTSIAWNAQATQLVVVYEVASKDIRPDDKNLLTDYLTALMTRSGCFIAVPRVFVENEVKRATKVKRVKKKEIARNLSAAYTLKTKVTKVSGKCTIESTLTAVHNGGPIK